MSDECGCLYNEGDDPEFFHDKWVTARKAYKCCECRETIPKGARYERVVGKWDGEITTYRTCIACQDIRKSLYCCGWVYLMLWEDVRDQIFAERGLTIACIDKLATIEGKKLLQRRWMEYLEEQK